MIRGKRSGKRNVTNLELKAGLHETLHHKARPGLDEGRMKIQS